MSSHAVSPEQPESEPCSGQSPNRSLKCIPHHTMDVSGTENMRHSDLKVQRIRATQALRNHLDMFPSSRQIH